MAEYEIEILKINTEDEELKKFLCESDNCTIFHRPAFLSYHDEIKFNKFAEFTFYHFIFRDSKKDIKAFIPGAIYEDENNIRIFKTPFYSSHGGMVFDNEFQFEDFEKTFDLFIGNMADQGVAEIHFSQTSDCYCGKNKEKNNYLNYILKANGFDVTSMELLMVKKIDNKISESYDNTIQRQINQAFKNDLEFKCVKGVETESYELLQLSQSRLGGNPTHTFAELQKISQIFPDKIYTFKTSSDSKVIAGITGFICNDDVLNTFYIYDDEKKRELKGMQFTYDNVFKFAFENKLKFVDLGPATFGLKPHRSLISYKEKYGIFPELRTTYLWKN